MGFQVGRRRTPRFEDFGSLLAHLTAEAQDGAIAPLYAQNAWGVAGKLIGVWQYSSVLANVRPVGMVNLTNVSDTPVAVIASGTGTTRAVEASPTLGTSGTATVWDTSAGSAIARDVAYTRSGTTVTFTAGDPGATAAGDLIIYDGACEFGVIGGDYWQPQAGATSWWASGLYAEGGAVDLLIPLWSAERFIASLAADILAAESSAGANSKFGVQWGNDTWIFGQQFYNDVTNGWVCGYIESDRPSPIESIRGTAGQTAPGTNVCQSYVTAYSALDATPATSGASVTTSSIGTSSDSDSFGFTPDRTLIETDTRGDVDRLIFRAIQATSGSLGATLQRFEIQQHGRP